MPSIIVPCSVEMKQQVDNFARGRKISTSEFSRQLLSVGMFFAAKFPEARTALDVMKVLKQMWGEKPPAGDEPVTLVAPPTRLSGA